MKQSSFAEAEVASNKKLTRRKRFMAKIEAITPWAAVVAALLSHSSKDDGRGRPPIGLERMPRVNIACSRIAMCAVLLLSTVLMSASFAGENPLSPSFDIAGRSPIATLSNGDLLWFGINDFVRWNPTTGVISHTPIANTKSVDSATDLADGLLFVGGKTGKGLPSGSVFWISASGANSVGQLRIARGAPKILNLRDQSVLVIGGEINAKPAGQVNTSQSVAISNAVDLLTLKNGALQITPLPDIPGPTRRGHAIVELANGEVLVVGGDSDEFLGCTSCTTDTYILNVQKREWRPGPALLEATAYASASLLPDGSVLVAGGWSQGHTWSNGPTRAVERLDARQQRFVQDTPMLTAMALQGSHPLPGAEQKLLLLAGGMTASIQTYDVANHRWHLAGETCEAYSPGIVAPFLFHGASYLWLFDNGSSLGPHCNNNLFTLRPETTRGTIIADPSGYALFRAETTMVAATDSAPALFIGGIVSGYPTSTESAAVDAVWPNGVLRSLAGLPAALSSARAFRLRDDSVVVIPGGSGEIMWIDEKGLLNNGEWINAGTIDTGTAGIGQLPDGNLLLLSVQGAVTQLTFSRSVDAKPIIKKTSLSTLNRPRDNASIRGLQDGRVIVAGGAVQTDKIALLTADSNRAESRDDYISVGGYLPARRYEIFDPASKTWKNSAPARSAGGKEVILDDGSVVKLGQITIKNIDAEKDKSTPAEKQETIIERSHPDGSGWSALGAIKPSLVDLNTARPIVINGELFLSGTNITDVSADIGRGNQMLQWYNQKARAWETLWESKPEDNERFNHGRVIIRTLANGKKLVLPVEAQ